VLAVPFKKRPLERTALHEGQVGARHL
jgi:hypothetical protein